MNLNSHINNRELSWLAFNNRVLQEAQDKSVPLLQRLRFLGIFANNQDEFIKVRVANLMRMARVRYDKGACKINGYKPEELLEMVNNRIGESQMTFDRTYHKIISQLEAQNIYLRDERYLSPAQLEFCHNFCKEEISQWLIPLMLRKTTKMPFLSDKKAYFAVRMSRKQSGAHRYAIVQIPVNSTCKRFVQLPSMPGKTELIFLDDIVRLCLKDIFFMFNYDEISAHSFTFIRDAELTVDDDITKSTIEKMEDGLEGRTHGEPVRLVYDREIPNDLLAVLVAKMKLSDREILAGGRYLMLRDLMSFPKVNPELEYHNPPALQHPDIHPYSSVLEVVKKKDVFLNFPYHTFNHVIDFLREAAVDPKVKKIYITLYRTAERSKVIHALVNAAKNGKEVMVMEELMARFDEEQNIENSDMMQKAGITVIHGFRGLKVHSKLILVERKENNGMKGFIYIGTGNFNESTARQYGDFGLLTSDEEAVRDARVVFDFLLNSHKHFRCRRLIVSPYFMRKQFESLIDKEIRNKQKGKEAYIYAKFNSLTDLRMVKRLYKASQAGVEVRLIVRGACCLQPQVPGVSDNIQAISIVDKYLEHARLAIFHNDGNEQVYIMSADWMTRNLDHRVEVGIPIVDKGIRQTIRDFFDIQWADNVKSRDLADIDKNIYRTNDLKQAVRSQNVLYDYYRKPAEHL